MKFKLSPLLLFLLLLIVLIIFVIFIKPTNDNTQESFISFYGSTNPNTQGLTIPNYSNPVDKLYDNDFFDPKNGNILRVYASAYDESKGQDTKGTSIDHIDVIDRTGHTTKYNNGEKIYATTLNSVPNNFTTWCAFSTNDAATYITSNQLIYSCWGQDTYLHVLDFNNNINACGFYYSTDQSSPIYTNFNMSMPKLQVSKLDNNMNNNSYVFNNINGMTFYQFTSTIFYSPLTGDLILVNNKGNFLIYNRSGSSISNFSNTGISASTKPWVEYDLVGNYMVIYVPYKTNTTIIILKLNADGSTYNLVSVGRFLADGSLQKDANTNVPIPPEALKANQPNNDAIDPSAMGFISSRYSNGTIGNNTITNSNNFTMQQMNDYLLKTQIIPPICPSCPLCPNVTGTCTNCGTSTNKTASNYSTPSGIYNEFKEVGSETKGLIQDTAEGAVNLVKEGTIGAVNLGREAVGGAVDLTKETVGGAVDLGREAVGGAVDLGREAVGGAVDLTKETVGGAVDLGREAVGGAVDLGREAVGGAVDLGEDIASGAVETVEDVGSGIEDIFENENENGEAASGNSEYGETSSGDNGYGGYSGYEGTPSSYSGYSGTPIGYYAQGGMKGPQDPFTWNGMLSEKPSSNFIPIVADFSKFGR